MTNKQAQSYAFLAMKKVGLPPKDIKKAIKEMYFQFDLKTEEEAESIFAEEYNKLSD